MPDTKKERIDEGWLPLSFHYFCCCWSSLHCVRFAKRNPAVGDVAAVQKAAKADKPCMRPISREKSRRYDIEILSLLSSHSRLSIVLKRGIRAAVAAYHSIGFPCFYSMSPHENRTLYEYAILSCMHRKPCAKRVCESSGTVWWIHCPGCSSLENGNGVQEDRAIA